MRMKVDFVMFSLLFSNTHSFGSLRHLCAAVSISLQKYHSKMSIYKGTQCSKESSEQLKESYFTVIYQIAKKILA